MFDDYDDEDYFKLLNSLWFISLNTNFISNNKSYKNYFKIKLKGIERTHDHLKGKIL